MIRSDAYRIMHSKALAYVALYGRGIIRLGGRSTLTYHVAFETHPRALLAVICIVPTTASPPSISPSVRAS